MRAIADAVRAGDGEAAWHAGERMVSYVVTELMRARLRMIARAPRRIAAGPAAASAATWPRRSD